MSTLAYQPRNPSLTGLLRELATHLPNKTFHPASGLRRFALKGKSPVNLGVGRERRLYASTLSNAVVKSGARTLRRRELNSSSVGQRVVCWS